jgi:hypothetical protein
MDLSVTIYMALLDEGVEVWRPVGAEQVGPDLFVVAGPVPDEEEWAYPPGSLVRCEPRQLSGDFGRIETSLMAVELIDRRRAAN